MMLSTHSLALEKLRHVDHALPLNERLCRFCKTQVESPEHALFECQASPAVLTLRATFLDKLFRTVPKLQNEMAELTSVEFLKAMIYERATIVLVAKFVYEVLEEFYAPPPPPLPLNCHHTHPLPPPP
ncbi:hypothetical protein DFH09DRAFT_830899, partial [Mycena vulgaris]